MNGSCTTTANSETCESLDSFPQAFHPTNQRIFETQGSEPECPRSNSARHVVRTRLPVVYNPDAPTPTKWIAFLDELLYPEDIPMFQEFVGYLLLPTTLFGVMTTASRRWNHEQFRIFWFPTPPSTTSNTPTTYTAWMVVKYGGVKASGSWLTLVSAAGTDCSELMTRMTHSHELRISARSYVHT